MDELISIFLETYFSEELGDEINRSFDLFDFYEYSQAYSGFIDILTNETNEDKEAIKDNFINELHAKLNYLLEQHTIKLIDEATIYQKNEVLTSLAHLQKLEDYTGVIRILESFASDEEQLATILSDSTIIDQTELMILIESFSPSMLATLKAFIYNKEKEQEQDAVTVSLVENFKVFCKALGDKHIGAALVQNGTLLGDRFATYIPYVEDSLVVPNNTEQTALNILSVILLSIDGYNSTLLVYRKYSFQLLKDLQLVSKVEVCLLDLIAKYTEYKKAHYESVRLSKISNQT